MPETIASIVDGELDRYTQSLIDRQRLVDKGVHAQVITALNQPAARSAVTLPGEGNLTARDLTREVPDERAEEVRAIARHIVEEAAKQAVLD